MLVLLDRLLYGYDYVRAIRERGAHVLIRLKRDIKPTTVRVLEDGSVLARIEPRVGLENWAERRRAGEHVLVRIISYRYEDPNTPGKLTTARLLTDCGYSTVFIAQHGVLRRGATADRLPRVKVEGGEPLWMFKLTCRGGMDAWKVFDDTLWKLQKPALAETL